MKKGFLLLGAAIIILAGTVYVSAQDRPPAPDPGDFGRPGPNRGDMPERPNRQGRQAGMPRNRPFGGPVAMEISGSKLFVVSGTIVYKIDANSMKLEIKRDLADASSGDESPVDMVIKKFDRNGDGKIARNEWRGPENMFDNMDINSDGFIDKEEIPQDLIQRAKKMGVRRPNTVGGPAAIKVAPTSLYIFLGGTVYRLKISDLEIEGSLELEPDDQPRMPNTERKRLKKERLEKVEQQKKPRKKKKNDEDDFGF